MDPSQELLATTNSLDSLIKYIETHSLDTILIAIGVLLAPFIARALLQLIWRFFMVLAQFFFKDQIQNFMRRKICALLQRYVDENLLVTEMPFYQVNMVTLYGLQWTCANVKVSVNQAEIRVNLGTTIRQYMKLWLRSLFQDFDYRAEQKTLLCNCIKDVRLSRSDIVVKLPLPDEVKSEKLLSAAEKNIKGAVLNFEKLRKLKLNIGFESGELLVVAAGEEFRFQNFFGNVENNPDENGSKCNVRFGCIYDGENISFNSLDDNLENFLLVASDIYFSDKIWRAVCAYCNYLPKDLQIKDGKLLDVRAKLFLEKGKFYLTEFSAKMDEAQFSWNAWNVDDLEVSLVSKNWKTFEIKKAVARVNECDVSVKGIFVLNEYILYSRKIELRVGKSSTSLINAWLNLKTGERNYEEAKDTEIDTQQVFKMIKNSFAKTISDKYYQLKDKLKSLTK